MKELKTIYWNRKTLNTAYIYFDKPKEAKTLAEELKQLNIGHTTYVEKDSDHILYGIKMFRIKNKMFQICSKLKEVLANG